MASGLDAYLRSVISPTAPRPGVGPSMLRGGLAGCANLYDFALEGYLAAERAGIRRRERLPVPVISVGNLSVGGTGKTPMTALLCRRLQSCGLRVTILSRGHGGSSTDPQVVSDPSGAIHFSPADAGDEPVLLARLCPGVPVLTGKDRRLSGREALRRWPVDVFVLDDGFQFWQLYRDLDIVLLDSERPFDNGFPLPRGLLREPARHLERAGIAVVTRADKLDDTGREAVLRQIHSYAPEIPVYFASHRATGLHPSPPAPLPEGEGCPIIEGQAKNPNPLISKQTAVVGLETLRGREVVALSAIAQPDSFHRTLVDATGCRIVRALQFDDHHRFTGEDVTAARQAIVETGAAALVMTEKDVVKWSAEDVGVPIYALRIAMAIEEEGAFVEEVLTKTAQSED